MWVRQLHISKVRNLLGVEMAPAAGWNILYGDNGAGKTSVLEALCILGRGRSFLTNRLGSVVQDGSASLRVVGRVLDELDREHVVGLERGKDETRVRVDGVGVRELSPLVRMVPVQVLTPRSHELVEGGAGRRRRFIDWGVFHVEQEFYGAWQRYGRVLRQRNAALRTRNARFAIWDGDLCEQAETIDQLRGRYVEQFALRLQAVLGGLQRLPRVAISYSRGWSAGVTLRQRLSEVETDDRRRGFTSVGPHRADLRLTVGRQPAAARLSRGQQKLLVVALHLTQAQLYSESQGDRSILLIDDLASELDRDNRIAVLDSLNALRVQIFATTMQPGMLPLPDGADRALFHVEQGRVSSESSA